MTAPVWVLGDPRAGTANQALGLAERLGVPLRTLPLGWAPLARLPLPWPSLAGLDRPTRALFAPPWPRLVVSAGRRSAPAALWLAARGVRSVHLMRPPFGAARFDALVIGEHDAPRVGGNVVPVLGALHRMSPERLAQARVEWASLAALPSPRVALLLGGPVRSEGLDAAAAGTLAAALAAQAGSVLATTSRRTGAPATRAVAEALRGVPHRLYAWGDAGANPYAGFLAQADIIVATGDSVSMISESLATHAALYIADLGAGPRHARFHASLFAAGEARPFGATLEAFARRPRDEPGRVAELIRARGWLD
jgi:mitochondrial fission protein ELM1